MGEVREIPYNNVEGENQLLKVILKLPHAHCGTCMPTLIHTSYTYKTTTTRKRRNKKYKNM